MDIPEEAIEATAEALYEHKYEYRAWDEAKSPESWREQALVAIHAAAPFILKDMRRMTAVEIRDRDSPQTMEAARQRIREQRKASQAEMVRAAKEEAWREGMLAQFEADLLNRPVEPNPHCQQAEGEDA